MSDPQPIIDSAIRSATPSPIDLEGPSTVVVPGDATLEVVDPQRFLPTPRRKTGQVALRETPSFCTYVNDMTLDRRTRLFADLDCATVTAVINDHATETSDDNEPGWGDHRAVLQLRKTPEWQHWANKDRTPMSQIAFAQHVEDGLAEIVEPVAAEVLEMAQTFQANTKVAFRSDIRLQSGQHQLAYEEQIDAKAGQQGRLTVPDRLVLALVPFDGMEAYKVEARLRFSIREGELKITYLLDRPHEVVRSAFGDVCTLIASSTGIVPLLGTPRG